MPVSARSATIAPKLSIDDRELGRPVVLDQHGRWYHVPAAPAGSAAPYATSAVPTYLGYHLGRDGLVPRDVPTIDVGPRVPGQTVGPLHLTAASQARLNAALADRGEAVVSSGTSRALVRPVSGDPSAPATVSAWLVSQAAGSSSSGSSPTAAQGLNLDTLTRPITDSKVLKDLGELLTFKSGKFVNWNQQNLETLKRDLKLGAPKNVASASSPAAASAAASAAAAAAAGGKGTASTRPGPGSGKVAAQELEAAGNVLPAPVPEPGSYLIFGLGAAAALFRRRLPGPWSWSRSGSRPLSRSGSRRSA